MITFRGWFIFSVAVALLGCEAFCGQAGKLTYQLTPDHIQPGDHAILEITLEGAPTSSEGAPTPVMHDELLEKTEGLQMLSRDAKNADGVYKWKYEFSAYNTGEFRIPPVEIQLGAQSFSTESKILKIETSRAEEDETLREEFGHVKIPFQWRKWIKLVGLSLLTAAVAVWLAYLLHHWMHRPKVEAEEVASQNDDPLVWLKEQLDRYRFTLASTAAPERPVDALSAILREFFSRSSSNPVETWTTNEFKHRFSRDAIAQRIGKLFETCDQVKFSGGRELSPLETARNLLGETEKILLP